MYICVSGGLVLYWEISFRSLLITLKKRDLYSVFGMYYWSYSTDYWKGFWLKKIQNEYFTAVWISNVYLSYLKGRGKKLNPPLPPAFKEKIYDLYNKLWSWPYSFVRLCSTYENNKPFSFFFFYRGCVLFSLVIFLTHLIFDSLFVFRERHFENSSFSIISTTHFSNK